MPDTTHEHDRCDHHFDRHALVCQCGAIDASGAPTDAVLTDLGTSYGPTVVTPRPPCDTCRHAETVEKVRYCRLTAFTLCLTAFTLSRPGLSEEDAWRRMVECATLGYGCYAHEPTPEPGR